MNNLINRIEQEVFQTLPSNISYMVSNMGNVMSLKKGKKRLMKITPSVDGYARVGIHKDGVITSRTVHSLVAETFLNHKADGWNVVCDHIDGNKLNNRLGNIQLVSQRDNCTKANRGSLTSKYTGVNYHKQSKQFTARIRIGDSRISLGLHKTDELASQHYQMALRSLHLYKDNKSFSKQIKKLVKISNE